MTQSAPHNAKLRKFASMMPAFFVGLLNRMSSIDLPLAPSAACFSAIKRFMALKRSRNTSTDSFVISADKNRPKTHFSWFVTLFQNLFYQFLQNSIQTISKFEYHRQDLVLQTCCFVIRFYFILLTGVRFGQKYCFSFTACFVSKSKFCTPRLNWMK